MKDNQAALCTFEPARELAQLCVGGSSNRGRSCRFALLLFAAAESPGGPPPAQPLDLKRNQEPTLLLQVESAPGSREQQQGPEHPHPIVDRRSAGADAAQAATSCLEVRPHARGRGPNCCKKQAQGPRWFLAVFLGGGAQEATCSMASRLAGRAGSWVLGRLRPNILLQPRRRCPRAGLISSPRLTAVQVEGWPPAAPRVASPAGVATQNPRNLRSIIRHQQPKGSSISCGRWNVCPLAATSAFRPTSTARSQERPRWRRQVLFVTAARPAWVAAIRRGTSMRPRSWSRKAPSHKTAINRRPHRVDDRHVQTAS